MVVRSPVPRIGRRGRLILVTVATLIVLLILLSVLVDILTDRYWFAEVHYSQVFSTMLWTRVVMFLVVGAVVGGLVAGNLYLAYRLRPLVRPHSAEQNALDRYRSLLSGRMAWWIGIISGLVAFFAGLSGEAHWQTWLLFVNGGSFGIKDPQFGTDIGWYIFDYPFWRYLLGVGFTATVLSLIGALVVHYLFGGVRLQGRGDRITTAARAQLTALVAAFVLLKAVSYVLDKRGLLLDHIGSVNTTGAGYADVNALMPAKTILAWISLIVAVAILVLSNAFIRNLVWPGMAIGLLVVSAIAIGGIYPFVVQRFIVQPNLPSKELTYIQQSIDATRAAFGLDKIKDSPLDATATTPSPALATDTGTVPNARVLDPAVVADTYTQLQRARGFYDFGEKLDIDRYTTGGKTQDYVVGIREIDYNSPAGQQWNWQNAHTIFTHGDGFVAAPANTTVCQGQPYFVSGVIATATPSNGSQPPQSAPQPNAAACTANDPQFATQQQGIYYGEGMGSYAVVGQPPGSKPREYDGPGPTSGSPEKSVTYSGTGGVSVSSFWRRMLYGWKYKEPNFLISGVFNQDSKVLYVRDPRERVEKVAPFLTIDGDPYPAVIGGKIVWILDGYTTASTYPYSDLVDLRTATSDTQVGQGVAQQASRPINYLRNSVKATVDAYNGTVTLYQFGPDDPILDAWNKAFGGHLIQPSTAITPELRAHFRYPEDQFKVQRDLLTRFHVTDPASFFSGQDFWQVPVDPANEAEQLKQPPYYLLAEFPDQNQPTFQLTSAMTLRSQPNLSALITGYYDAQGDPQLEVLETPQVAGPTQAQQKLQNDPTIRKDLSLFQSNTSRVVYGNLLSLPIDNGILYVEPVYIESTAPGSWPLMKKVLLSYGDYLAYDDTVAAGVQDLVDEAKNGTNTPTPTTPTTPAPPTNAAPGNSAALNAAIAQINKALADLKKAEQNGDFTAIGQALTDLNNATAAYEKAQNSASAPTASPTQPTPTPSK
ncbi:MAG TPA: UPF0182 family protein [Micromonosporaceae bacterium]|nr:UPF0182 family protein [Micromonosporaceae bacterium]